MIVNNNDALQDIFATKLYVLKSRQIEGPKLLNPEL